jgi:glycosyltransferase involved in cell wall biosynthesis
MRTRARLSRRARIIRLVSAGRVPSVTVLLPVKSFHPPYLTAAVRSILRQTSPAWRLVVIGEVENVSTLGALLDNELRDSRVELIVNEGRRLPGAVNTGMRYARTGYVALLLGDDLWASEAVAALNDAIEASPDIDFFHSGRLFIDAHGRAISSVYSPRASFSIDEFVQGSPVKHLLCWRREKALAIGGVDESGIIGPDDWDFPWTMAEVGARFMALQNCLYHYRDHRESYRLTTHVPLRTQTRDIRRVLRKHGVGRLRSYRTIRAMKRRHLRQCLYRSRLDRFIKQRVLGKDTRVGWHETYR